MLPSHARSTLLDQHERLRQRLAALELEATLVAAGEARGPQLRIAVASLRDAFAEHNLTEQAWLEPMLGRSAGGGPRRIERMVEEHAGEHAALQELLAGSDASIAARVAEIAELLLAHMAAEERTFLSPQVLRNGDDPPG